MTVLQLGRAVLMSLALVAGGSHSACSTALANPWRLAVSDSDHAGRAAGEAQPSQSGPSETLISWDATWFEDEYWLASCDNLRTCTAIGTDGLGNGQWGEATIVARITRGSGASDMPELVLLIQADAENAPPAGTAWELRVDGPIQIKRSVKFSSDPEYEDFYVTARFSGREARRIIMALARGNRLTVRPPLVLQLTPQQRSASVRVNVEAENNVVAAPITLPLGGSSAVLRWVDDRQKRAGGVTALVARGPGPARAMPPVPRAPVVKRAQLPPQDNLPGTVPAVVSESVGARACAEATLDEDLPGAEPSADVEAYLKENARIEARLAPDLLLVSVYCGSGAYNVSHRYFLVSESGVQGAGVGSEGEEPDTLVNSSFDPASAELHAFAKGRGLGDCGLSETYVWDGTAFRLTEVWSMPKCIGMHPSLWHLIFRAKVR
jgi:hypothetical protein